MCLSADLSRRDTVIYDIDTAFSGHPLERLGTHRLAEAIRLAVLTNLAPSDEKRE
jgi:hypothetical protein